MPQLTSEQIKQAIQKGVTPQQLQSYMATGNVSSSYQQPQQKKSGFLRSVADSIIRPFGEVGVSLYNAGKSATSGFKKDYTRRAYDLPFLGETQPFMTGDEDFGEFTKKTIGYGADIGSNFLGYGATKGIVKGGLSSLTKQGIKRGAIEGAVAGGTAGFGKSLTEGDDYSEAALQGGVGVVGGGILGGVLGGSVAFGKNVAKPLISKTSNTALSDDISRDLVDNLFTSTKPNKKKYNALVSKGIIPEKEFIARDIQPEVVNGRATFAKSVPKLKSEYAELNAAFDKQLQRYKDFEVDASDLEFSINKIIDSDRTLAQTGNKEVVREQSLNILNRYIKDNGGKASFNLPAINEFKKGQYAESSKYKKMATPDYMKSDASSVVARAFKENIEEYADDVAVKTLNDERGKVKALLDFISAEKGIEGTAVKGGKLGLYFGRTIGSMAGADKGILGSIIGAMGGDVIARVLQQNAVLGPLKRMYIKRLGDGYENKVLNETLDYLNRIERGEISAIPRAVQEQIKKDLPLLLPAPKTGRPTKSINTPIKVFPKGSKEYIGKDTVVNTYSPPKTSILKSIKNDNRGVVQAYKETGNLTTKILKDLEGKTTVSKQYILDATNRPELKQVERDLIRDIVSREGDIVNVADFAKKVKTELLPLKRESVSPRYENITLPPELRGEVGGYSEHIYSSPIKTSAGDVHFGRSQYQERQGDGGYFGHTRVEDLPSQKWLDTPNKSNLSFKDLYGGDTRRVIEVQSDLYQKGNLERELNAVKPNSGKFDNANKGRIAELLPEKESQEYQKLWQEVYDGQFDKSKAIGEKGLSRINELEKLAEKSANSRMGASKLSQYNDPTAHFRMIREEVKKAAQDGKTKLQFPTGETAMKIEGLGDKERWIFPEGKGQYGELVGRDVLEQDLKIGTIVNDAYQDWIITDVLGDGKFKAVPKNRVSSYSTKEVDDDLLSHAIEMGEEETFDISGKVDTNNPIYKFYEKDVAKYLKSKYNAKLITDNKGVSWWEVPIKKEFGKQPVEAFGKALLSPLMIGAGAMAVGAAAPVVANKLRNRK